MGCCVLCLHFHAPCWSGAAAGGSDPAAHRPLGCICWQLKNKEATGCFLLRWRVRLRVRMLPASLLVVELRCLLGHCLGMAPSASLGWSVAACARETIPLSWAPAAAGDGCPGLEIWRSVLRCRCFCSLWELQIAVDKAWDLGVFQPCESGHRWKACRRGVYSAGNPSGAVPRVML